MTLPQALFIVANRLLAMVAMPNWLPAPTKRLKETRKAKKELAVCFYITNLVAGSYKLVGVHE